MDSGTTLSGIERQEQIVQQLTRMPRITISSLCEQFSVSQATARRDLETLAEQGKLQRVHGGAIAIRRAPPELPIPERISEQAAEKQRIGQAAADMILEGETVFLGSGTTVLAVARCLRERKNLTVITNSLQVINALADAPTIIMVSLGGILRRSELSFIGHITEQSLAEVRADKVILGIRAVSTEQGLTNDYLPETMTDRAILAIGRQVIVVADHTKCERVSTAFVAPLTCVQIFITDTQAPVEFVSKLRRQGVEVKVV